MAPGIQKTVKGFGCVGLMSCRVRRVRTLTVLVAACIRLQATPAHPSCAVASSPPQQWVTLLTLAPPAGLDAAARAASLGFPKAAASLVAADRRHAALVMNLQFSILMAQTTDPSNWR
jgi:hypothetical protein